MTDEEFMSTYDRPMAPKRSELFSEPQGRRLGSKTYVDTWPNYEDSFENGYTPEDLQKLKSDEAVEVPAFKNWFEEGAVTIPID